jgi:hypothetical protein
MSGDNASGERVLRADAAHRLRNLSVGLAFSCDEEGRGIA